MMRVNKPKAEKVIVYDDNAPKNEPLQIINPNVDISVAQNVLNQGVSIQQMLIWLVRYGK